MVASEIQSADRSCGNCSSVITLQHVRIKEMSDESKTHRQRLRYESVGPAFERESQVSLRRSSEFSNDRVKRCCTLIVGQRA